MPGLIFSTEELNMVVEQGKVMEGSVSVRHEQGRSFEGVVRSSGICMECPEPRILPGNGIFPWRFSARDLREGDVIDGAFRIISSQGEYRIPYHVVISDGSQVPSADRPDTPEGFLELARTDWNLAAERFRSPDFGKNLRDPHLNALWRGLSRSTSVDTAMEQFLVEGCGKEPVLFDTDTRDLDEEILGRGYRQKQKQQDYVLKVKRLGWGHTRLRVALTGDFLSVPRFFYEGGAFEDDQLTIPVTVHFFRLHAGNNYGQILLTWAGGSITIPVTIRYSCRREDRALPRHEIRRCLFMLTDNWQDYACGRIGREEWRDETRKLLNRLSVYDRDGFLARLMNVHLLTDEGRIRDASQELGNMRRYLAGVPRGATMELSFQQYRYETDELYCYRLYLTALCYQDEYISGRILKILKERYSRNRTNWRIAWFYLELEPEYAGSSTARWEFLRRQFARGSRTPVLYMEAWKMIRENPPMIHERDSYLARNRQDGSYLLQILLYAVRRGIMTTLVMDEVLILVDRSKGFSNALWRILTLAYQLESLSDMRREILERICLVLIREEITRPSVHGWYARALKEGINLRGLDQAFVCSCPGSGEEDVPDRILEDLLPYQRLSLDVRSFIYRKLYEKREDLPDCYARNRGQIRTFLQEQLVKGRANKDLLILYRAALTDRSLGLTDIRALVPYAYAALIEAGRAGTDSLILTGDYLMGEQVVSAGGSQCYVPVYGHDTIILAADRKGIRTLVEPGAVRSCTTGGGDWCDFTDEELRLLRSAAPESRNIPFLMSLIPVREGKALIGPEEENICLGLLSSREVTEEGRDMLLSGVLDYEMERADLGRMQEILSACARQLERPVWRTRALDYLVLTKSREALNILLKRGTCGVSEDTLLRICQGAAEDFAQRRDPVLAELCFEAFRKGSRYPALLTYISRYFVGLSEELEQVRKAMTQQGMPCESLMRRICEQLQFSGGITPAFEDLVLACACLPDARSLLPPLLIPLCKSLFEKEKEAGTDLLDLILIGNEMIPREDASYDACRLLWLRQMAGAACLSREEEAAAAAFLAALLDRGILFPFFMSFRELDERLDPYRHDTFITCTLMKEPFPERMLLHTDPAENERHPVRPASLVMHRMFGGTYVCSLPLFTGEEMHYRITDDPAGQHVVKEGLAVRQTEAPCSEEDRYAALERIMTARSREQTEAVISLLEQYYRNDKVAEAVFSYEKDV